MLDGNLHAAGAPLEVAADVPPEASATARGAGPNRRGASSGAAITCDCPGVIAGASAGSGAAVLATAGCSSGPRARARRSQGRVARGSVIEKIVKEQECNRVRKPPSRERARIIIAALDGSLIAAVKIR
jgi:hypothetical protein